MDLLGNVDIELGGKAKPSEQIARILAQFERVLPGEIKSNQQRKLLEAEIVSQQARYIALRCRDAHEQDFQRHLRASSAPADPPPKPSATPAMPAGDPFDEGRALVDAGRAAVPAAGFAASDLAGTWRTTGYYCDGPEAEEIVVIAVAASGALVATKIRGDRCVYSGEVSWRGMLEGKTIRGDFFVRDPAAPRAAGYWSAASWEVVSRDEITGMGLVMRRDRTAP